MRRKILQQDSVIFGLLSSVLFILSAFQIQSVAISLAIIVLSLFAYRHGTIGFVLGAISGTLACAIVFALNKGTLETTQLIYFGIISGIPGLFAKNVHRTLNNRKMNPVILNVVVAQFIVSVLYFGETLVGDKIVTLLDSSMLFIISVVLMLLVAYMNPEKILTKRSAFLTHKERSKLLND